MAYFSNGTEGSIYHNQYCSSCIHDVDEDCAVWMLHLLHNYEQVEDKQWEEVLDALIPRSSDGLSNLECNLFARRS